MNAIANIKPINLSNLIADGEYVDVSLTDAVIGNDDYSVVMSYELDSQLSDNTLLVECVMDAKAELVDADNNTLQVVTGDQAEDLVIEALEREYDVETDFNSFMCHNGAPDETVTAKSLGFKHSDFLYG